MSRFPILIKLTAAFAAAMLLTLAAAATFVYVRLRLDLDDRVQANLNARAIAAAAAIADGTDLRNVAVEDPEESFVQVISVEGVLQSAGSARGPSVSDAEISQAQSGELVVEHNVPGIDGKARILLVPLPTEQPTTVLAVGQSLRDRNEALASVLLSFLIGGGVALAVASLVGHAVARSALAPIASIRRRASEISAGSDTELLPLPPAHDEVRRLAETLNDMLRRLQDSYARERRFVDDASHELRTPLAVVQTDLEGALLSGAHAPDVRAALTSALSETRRLIRLAEDLLVLARAADGAVPVAKRVVLGEELAEWARHTFDAANGSGARELMSDAAATDVIHADPERLRQVVTNLIDNALRHGSGTVRLGTEQDALGTAVTVSDEGVGFPAEFAPHALDRLTRAPGADRRSGAGLGLAIVNAIAQAHGGNVTVSSGSPALVRVWFPAPTLSSSPHR